MYGKGISKIGDILDLAAELDVIHKSGSWYSYKEDRIGQGRENAKKYLTENPEICAEVEKAVREANGLTDVIKTEEGGDEENEPNGVNEDGTLNNEVLEDESVVKELLMEQDK